MYHNIIISRVSAQRSEVDTEQCHYGTPHAENSSAEKEKYAAGKENPNS